jgi:hypothetical protein
MSQMGLDTKTYWLTDRQSLCDFDFDLLRCLSEFEFSVGDSHGKFVFEEELTYELKTLCVL